MLAQGPAMVTKKHNDGIVSKFQSVQSIEDFADLRVNEADACKVSAFESAQFFFTKSIIERLGCQSNRRNIGDVLRRFLRQKNFFEGIKLEIFLRGNIGNVGTIKTGCNEEWPI